MSGQGILLIIIDRNQFLNVSQAHDFPNVTLRLQHAYFRLTQLEVLRYKRQQAEAGAVHESDLGHIQNQMTTALLSDRFNRCLELFAIGISEISRHLKNHTVRHGAFFCLHRHESLLHLDR